MLSLLFKYQCQVWLNTMLVIGLIKDCKSELLISQTCKINILFQYVISFQFAFIFNSPSGSGIYRGTGNIQPFR